MRGCAAELGYTTVDEFEQLHLGVWYGLLERWFVRAHASAFAAESMVLEWLTVTLPEAWAREYPDPETHGMSEAAQASARKAEQMYGAPS